MPLWLEVLVLVQASYGLGLGLGWLVWGGYKARKGERR